ncbi:hypothetical protein HNP37_003140 [Flavobacterium nitrogenifigens]|uniref:Uncharacterized protein n=2 Tax=Flavobacterium TaxID=237 RepID=A0A7W7IYZ1_9FLAO|nr:MULTISPECIES: hypothetical protein [Flavobacterium]MBB4803065.1 hypothetical protein [Flavobacterium nitrogenifigens]MBB6388023.1 hypothetical protein [Flavobacterium notoginsengisoli]
MKYLIILFFAFSVSFAQSPKRAVKKLGDNPVFFIDSVNVDKDDLMKYSAEEISAVTVFKGKEAIELLGEDGKDGAVYVETIAFCKKRYWKYFASKSAEYKKMVNPDDDKNVQYIINDRVLKDQPGNLSMIDDKIFKSIKLISKEELSKKYKIENKDFGFLIVSDVPKNLYHGNQKF